MLITIAAIAVLAAFLFYVWVFCKLGSSVVRDEERRELERQEQDLGSDTDVNRCVCCGEAIPEGFQVCKKCSTE